MEQHSRNYQTNQEISGKRQRILLLGTEKKENEKLKALQKLLEYISQSPQYNTEGRARPEEKMFQRNLSKNQAYLEILLSYLNNPSEEAIFRSNKIKEEHETITLQNEEVMLKNTKIFD